MDMAIMLYYQWSYKVKEDSHITIIIIIIIIIVIIMMIIIIIIPIMTGALGTVSGNAQAWYGRLSLPGIFGSARAVVSHPWDCPMQKVLCL